MAAQSPQLAGNQAKKPQLCNPERNAMHTVSVRLNKTLAHAARVAAKAEFRTVPAQIEYWAKVGRAALDNPDLPVSFIAESLASMSEPRSDAQPFIPRSRNSN